LYDPEPEIIRMARQGLNSPGLAIRCPTPHLLVVAVAEDQADDSQPED